MFALMITVTMYGSSGAAFGYTSTTDGFRSMEACRVAGNQWLTTNSLASLAAIGLQSNSYKATAVCVQK